MTKLKIDIVSDVVCPWCVVGYKQLEQALEKCDVDALIHWHPFELNPGMPEEGQQLDEHITQKYGSSAKDSAENRQRLTALGNELGFTFNFSADSRMVNTFKAHQLLHWAGLQSAEFEHELKLALFSAHFTDQQDVNSDAILLAAVIVAGLDMKEAQEVLNSGQYETDVRKRQQLWTSRGISGVPTMVLNDKYLVTGAQDVENYRSVITQVLEEAGTE